MNTPVKPDAPPSSEPGLRLFVAIPLPDEVRAALAELQERLRKGFGFTPCRPVWSPPDRMHLTLRFLGLVKEERVAALADDFARAATQCPPLTLTSGGLGVFPHWRAPTTLWIGMTERSGALARLQSDVEAIAQRHACKEETNPFRPHVTLARFKSKRGIEAARSIVESHRVFKVPPFVAEEANLFQSLTAAGAITHSQIRRFPLESA